MLLPSSPLFLVLASVLASFSLPVGTVATEFRQLTAVNFESSIKEGVWFIEFFSPYCPHCKHFTPIWERLVAHVETQENPITLAQVNCITQQDLCASLEIKSYPTLRIYRDGEYIEEFKKDRNFDLLTEFIASHLRKTPLVKPNPDGTVLDLIPTTFSSTIAQGPVFVKFFAPWCGHCKKLAPIWLQFASSMKNRIAVAEVNCDNHKSLCTAQKIPGFPTVTFYQHGRSHEYTGRRTLEALEAFANAALAPPLTTVSSSDLKTIVEEQEVVFVLIHDGLDRTLRDNVEEASQPLHGTPKVYAIKSSADLLSSLSVPSSQRLPLLISLKDHSMKFFQDFELGTTSTIDEISNWLVSNALPTTTQLSGENFAQVMGSSTTPPGPGSPSRLVVLVALRADDDAGLKSVKQVATAWHREYSRHLDRYSITFAWMDKLTWASWLKSVYGVRQRPEPAVVLADHSHLLYYDTMPDGSPIPLDVSQINVALQAVRDGSLTPKHSENMAERFARRVNNAVLALQTAVLHHPFLALALAAAVIFGIVTAVKRAIQDDPSVYVNSKSGARLD